MLERLAGEGSRGGSALASFSGIRSRSEWYRQMPSRHGAKVRDAAGKVVATVSYNARMWRPSGEREQMVWGRAGVGGQRHVPATLDWPIAKRLA